MKALLMLVVLAVAVWMLVLRGRGRPGRPGAAEAPGSGRQATAAPGVETMCACAHCGVHLPRSEAITDAAGRPYCSEAHRRSGPPRAA